MLTFTRKDFSYDTFTLHGATQYLHEHCTEWETVFNEYVEEVKSRNPEEVDSYLKLSVQPLHVGYMAVAKSVITVSDLPLDIVLQLQSEGWNCSGYASEDDSPIR